MRQVGLLRVAQVAHERTGGAHRRLPALESKAFESADPQLIQQRLARRFQFEVPAVDLGDRHGVLLDFRQQRAGVNGRGHDDLAGPQHGNLGAQRGQTFRAGVLRDIELTGREIHQRDAVF